MARFIFIFNFNLFYIYIYIINRKKYIIDNIKFNMDTPKNRFRPRKELEDIGYEVVKELGEG